MSSNAVFGTIFMVGVAIFVVWYLLKIDKEDKNKTNVNDLQKLIDSSNLFDYAFNMCSYAKQLYDNDLWNRKAKIFGELLFVYNSYTDRFYIGNELHGFISPRIDDDGKIKTYIYTAGIIDSHTEYTALKNKSNNYEDYKYLSDNIDKAYLEFNNFVEDLLNKYKEI